jgi:DNA-binding CsgD family transcriptional regulator
MSSADARALLPFLRYLGTFPDPDGVARAMAKGPLGCFDALAANLMIAGDEDLVAISSHGFSLDGAERYRGISLRADLPICISVRENRTIVTGTGTLLDDFQALALDRDLWEGLRDRIGSGEVVSVPIASQGAVVGAYGFIAPSREAWTVDDYALLDGIGAALGIWLTNPASRLGGSGGAAGHVLTEQLHLGERQVQILRMVERGKSNAAIAATLGYSESTVKQELQRVLRTLRIDDRHAAVARAREIGLLE